jgi:RhtB (resistance to homoserine/threonine) family protein
MDANLTAFVGVAALLIIVPGPDTAIVTKNAFLHGRRAALGTALGVNTGLLVWTVATALGLAALVRASDVAFTVLKIAGAAYLVWLGIQALRDARRPATDEPKPARAPRKSVGAAGGFRQGVASDLANPKIAVFFTSLLPQFVTRGAPVLEPFLVLGGVFLLMTTLWLLGFALVASRASSVLRRPRVKRALDRLTGVVLVGLGLRLATKHR